MTLLSVDGQQQSVEIKAASDRLIEGEVSGSPVTLHLLGDGWFSEVDGHPAPLTIGVEGAVPEAVFRAVSDQLDADHRLTWDRVMTDALAMWALNRQPGGSSNRALNRAYLDAAFPDAA